MGEKPQPRDGYENLNHLLRKHPQKFAFSTVVTVNVEKKIAVCFASSPDGTFEPPPVPRGQRLQRFGISISRQCTEFGNEGSKFCMRAWMGRGNKKGPGCQGNHGKLCDMLRRATGTHYSEKALPENFRKVLGGPSVAFLWKIEAKCLVVFRAMELLSSAPDGRAQESSTRAAETLEEEGINLLIGGPVSHSEAGTNERGKGPALPPQMKGKASRPGRSAAGKGTSSQGDASAGGRQLRPMGANRQRLRHMSGRSSIEANPLGPRALRPRRSKQCATV